MIFKVKTLEKKLNFNTVEEIKVCFNNHNFFIVHRYILVLFGLDYYVSKKNNVFNCIRTLSFLLSCLLNSMICHAINQMLLEML